MQKFLELPYVYSPFSYSVALHFHIYTTGNWVQNCNLLELNTACFQNLAYFLDISYSIACAFGASDYFSPQLFIRAILSVLRVATGYLL